MSLTLHLGPDGQIQLEVPSGPNGTTHRVTVADHVLLPVVRQILQAQAENPAAPIGATAAPTQWDLDQQFIKRLAPKTRRISSAPQNLTLEDLGL